MLLPAATRPQVLRVELLGRCSQHCLSVELATNLHIVSLLLLAAKLCEVDVLLGVESLCSPGTRTVALGSSWRNGSSPWLSPTRPGELVTISQAAYSVTHWNLGEVVVLLGFESLCMPKPAK